MKPKIYIDGKEGTTGLQIYERLGARSDIELLLIDEDKRKDVEERRKFLNAADIVFLCLPDAAAIEAVTFIDNEHTRVIDASTAHRVSHAWAYGFAELSAERRKAIIGSRRVANPGCHATGFLASVTPLVQLNMLPFYAAVPCYSVTGYSGGGKQRITEYESVPRSRMMDAPRTYGLNLRHKHVPEMQRIAGLDQAPVFCPIIADYYKGMATTIMLQNCTLIGNPTAQQIHERLAEFYEGQTLVTVAPFGGDEPMISANLLAGTDSLRLIVCGHETQTTVTAQFDNLGKGAAGAAVQNMNLMLGYEETTGLTLYKGE